MTRTRAQQGTGATACDEGSGRPIVRRRRGPPTPGTLDVPELASIAVSSEQEIYGIDNVFDGQSGPGGSCWVAATPGLQTIVLRFHGPLPLRTIIVESEEHETRTMEVELAVYSDERASPVEAALQTFRFSAYSTSFQRAVWELAAGAVTALRWRVTPRPASRRASLTSIILR